MFVEFNELKLCNKFQLIYKLYVSISYNLVDFFTEPHVDQQLQSIFLFFQPVHVTPKKFENGGFSLKTHQMFSVHTITGHFGLFVHEVNLGREIT